MPVALDGERLGLVELIERAAQIGMRHGVGIVDHIEDRIVGLKVRDIYEVPGGRDPAHRPSELERLVGTIHQNQFKPQLDRQWAYLVYAGLWWEPLRTDLDAYMDSVNAHVTGDDRAQALQGQRAASSPASRPTRSTTRSWPRSPSRAALFSQQASPGFIELWSLQSRLAWRLRNEGK